MPSRRTLLGIFFLSGASALVYQVIWARQLGLVFGNTTTSVSIVLAAFMAGLALGAAVAGRALVRLGNPLRVYAVIEGLIAIYALAFGALLRGAEALYPALFSDETSATTLLLFRILFSFALLLLPTTLMGATLPLLAETLHRLGIHPEDWNAGRLYAANTFGAACGSIASGFFGIELFGIHGTTVIAAAGNAGVMGIGWWLARRLPASVDTARAETPAASPGGPTALLIFFAGVGGLALAAEVLWTRALTFMIGSSTYAFSSILIVYLVGIALGSWWLAGRVRAIAHPERWLPVLVLAAGGWHLLAVRAIDPLHLIAVQIRFGGTGLSETGTSVAVGVLYVVILLLMFPPALLSGALFPLVTRLLGGEGGDRGGPIARAYTWNTVGSVIGSLVGGFLIAPNFVQLQAIHLLALGFAALAVFALWQIRPAELPLAGRRTAVAAAMLAGLALLSLLRPDPMLRILRARDPNVVISFHEPGLQGTTTVRYPKGGADRWSQLLVNGVGMTVKAFVTKAMAHLPLAVHGQAEDTLVVAFGMGTSYRAALSHGGRVDVVELVPEVLDAFDHFYADAAEIRNDPRGRMIVADGRNFLLLTRKRYDVITMDPPPPIDAAGVNHLYSREFLELVRDHLKPGGIAAHWVPSHTTPHNGVSDEWTRDMLIRTFVEVFPHVRAVDGEPWGTHLLGAMHPFEIDPRRMRRHLEQPAVKRDLEEFPWDAFSLDRLVAPRVLPDFAGPDPPPLTDDRPRLEFNLIRNARRGLFHTMLRVFL